MEIKKLNTNWGAFIVSGLIAIVYALLTFLVPEQVAKTVILVTGIAIIIAGFVCLLISLRHKKNMRPWGMLCFESVVMIALGIVSIFWSQQTIIGLLFIMGLWSVIMGAFMLFVIFSIKGLDNRGFYILSGILSIVFGILLITHPFDIAKIFIIISGIIALVFGVIMMMFGFTLRKIDKEMKVEIVDEKE